MFTLHFSEGKKVQLGYRLLKVLAENLPEEKEYTELTEALLELGMPSISEELIGNSLLTKAQYDTLWENGNLDVRRSLVDEEDFLANLSDAQAQDIINMNDPKMFESVARWAELLYPDEKNEQAIRLSGSMADSVLEHISTHPDSNVRAELVGNASAPAKFLPSLRHCIEQGMSRHIPLVGMSSDDVDALAHAPLDTLEYVAGNVEEIRSRTVRREVAKVLIAHPDPSVRLALAENCKAPEFVLKALLNDPDVDVASTARKKLNDRYDTDDND
ncbi:MAG: hypothetical protein IJU65_05480 [Desulfovibrio sp.]|nr:hypothetical protein [Desulfovibrio sp.]